MNLCVRIFPFFLIFLSGFCLCATSAIAAPEISIEQPAGEPLGGGVVAWGNNSDYQVSTTSLIEEVQSRVAAIAAGGLHSVALKENGSIVAWGKYIEGQTTVPVAAQSGVVSIAAGEFHTIALKLDGSVIAWGANYSGQTTVPVAAQSDVMAIAAGGYHTVALKSDGSVIAWGYDTSGQTTVPPEAQSGIIAIAAGGYHTVALKSNGSVIAWGLNDSGQTSVPAAAQSGVIAIAAGGNHTVALKSDGSVIAWGLNESGQTTVPSAAQSGVITIAAGAFHTVALKRDGSVVAWGGNNDGQSSVPMAAQSRVAAIATNGRHNLALKAPIIEFGDQTIGAQGSTKTFTIKNTGTSTLRITNVSLASGNTSQFSLNTTQMLGSVAATTGETTFSVSFNPTTPGISEAILRVHNDDPDEAAFSIVLKGSGFTAAPEIMWEYPAGGASGGGVVSWGSSQYGVLNVPPTAQSGVVAVSACYGHTLALKTNGSVVAWGDNSYGQTNVPATAQSRVVRIAAGYGFSLALRSNGSVVTWPGGGEQAMVPMAAHSGVVAIAAFSHSVALKNDGSVIAWGQNYAGQTTVPLAAQSGVVAIAAGNAHTLALKSDGSVVAWGDNAYEQTTVPLAAQSGVVAIAAGWGHSVALKNDGSVVAWGLNDYGQTTVPVGAQSRVVAIAAGWLNTVALKNDGSIVVWGENSSGQKIVPGVDALAVTAGASYVAALKAPLSPFAHQIIGSSATRTLALKNIGTLPLTLSEVKLVGENAADFSANTAGTLGSVPAVNGETSFTITFTPSAPGVRQTTLRVISDDPDEGIMDIVIKGVGVAAEPEISLEQPGGRQFGGRVVAWDLNSSIEAPTELQSGVVAVAKGGPDLVALKSDGSVVVWPYYIGGLKTVPAEVSSGVVAIESAFTHAVALKNHGEVVAWGDNHSGQTNVPAAAQSGVVAIAAAARHTVALKSDGSVVAWGVNDFGQTDVPVAAQSGVVAIATSMTNSLALKKDGSIIAWGHESGITNVPEAATANVVAIAVGDLGHAVALKNDGSVVVWGTSSFVPVAAQSGVVAVTAAGHETMALKTDGSVIRWDPSGEVSVPVAAQTGVRAISVYAVLKAAPPLSFGLQKLAGSSSKTFTIRNTGNSPLNISQVSVFGGNASDFTVNTTGMLGSIPAYEGETTFSVTFNPAASGVRQTTLRVLNNDADEGTLDIVLTGTGETSFAAWTQAEFGANAANPTLAGELADPDGDGLPNLLEYAFRTNPNTLSPNSFDQPIPVFLAPDNTPAMRLSFPFRTDTTDLRYVLKRTADWVTWTEVYRHDLDTGIITRTGVTSEESSSTQTITITDPVSGAGYFWRLVVEQP